MQINFREVGCSKKGLFFVDSKTNVQFSYEYEPRTNWLVLGDNQTMILSVCNKIITYGHSFGAAQRDTSSEYQQLIMEDREKI